MHEFHTVLRTTIEGQYQLDSQPLSEELLIAGTVLGEGPARIKPAHVGRTLQLGAREGWRRPDGRRVVVCIREVDGTPGYLMLVVATDKPGETGRVIQALRLYGFDPAWRPTDAFAEALLRYGADFTLGASEPTAFVAHLLVESADGNTSVRVIADDEGHEYDLRSVINSEGQPPYAWFWTFVLDVTAYGRDVAARRAPQN